MIKQQSNAFPQESEEIHLVTASGKTAFIAESMDRALLRWHELGKPEHWKMVKVTVLKDDISPKEMLPKQPAKVLSHLRLAPAA